jgi:hypothetical protein
MRWLIAAMAIALTMASAQAQVGGGPNGQLPGSQIGQHASKANQGSSDAKTSAQRKAEEKAYNAALHNLPDKQYDPWHGVR